MTTRFGIGSFGLVATIMIAVLLLACSTPTQSPPASSGTVAGETKPYGSFTIGYSQRIGRVDPPSTSTDYPGFVSAVFEGLTRRGPDGRVGPGIAERWEISPDGTAHTFYIRKGVKFHDGSDLTGADVKFTLDRILDPESAAAASSTTTTWRTLAPQVELRDDYTVVLRFKSPQFELLKVITDFSGLDAVVPKKYIEDKGVDYFRKNPVGSGPWKVVKHVVGERVELEANESYWDTARIPKFKNLTILTVPNEASKVAMLRTGELDMGDVSPESAVALRSAGLRIKAWDGGQQATYVPLYDIKNSAQHAFGDVRVRKATSLAINRKEMADKLFAGYAEPGIVARTQRTFDYFDANQLKTDPYDPEQAKKLLAEAGYANGFNTKFWDVGGGGILSMFDQALAGYWSKTGINVTINPIENAAFLSILTTYSDPRIWNSVFATGVGAVVGAGTAGFDLAPAFHSTKGFFRNHANKRLDELMDLYPTIRDPAERKRVALEATVMAKNEYIYNSVLIVSATWALGPKIGDFTPLLGWAGNATSWTTVTHAK